MYFFDTMLYLQDKEYDDSTWRLYVEAVKLSSLMAVLSNQEKASYSAIYHI
jgi:hypothetical protein